MNKLINPQDYQPQQIVKRYFSDIGSRGRNQLLADITRISNGSIESFNDAAFQTLTILEAERKKDVHKILKSIIYNTLGYEANEEIQHSIYADYTNPHIRKHAKPFINGQYKIFRNDHENLLEHTEQQTSDVLSHLDETITLIAKHTVEQTIELKDMYRALDKNPKAINGIVKKVLAA